MNTFIRRVRNGPIVCSGNFDDEFRSIPFQGFLLCSRDLLETVLSKDTNGEMRMQIRNALGEDIHLLVSHIPALATVLDTDYQMKLSNIGKDDDTTRIGEAVVSCL